MISWLSTDVLDPPHRVTRPDQVIDLANQFVESGWDRTKPALVGYKLGERVQLLSGSHRYAAAKLAQISVPVVLVPETIIKALWGSDCWCAMMKMGNTAFESEVS